LNNIYAREIKDRAKSLYLQGESFAQIAREFRCNAETVSNWCKKEGWLQERTIISGNNTTLETLASSLFISTDLIPKTQAYQEMLLKGRQGLEQHEVKSARDAGFLIDRAIRGLEAVREDVISTVVLSDIASAIMSEISDRDLLFRLGERLKQVFRKHGSKIK
jgi:hypothetical protein